MNNGFFGKRNAAIDMLRGLTMFLMIMVNHFWTVMDVPHALEHFDTLEDGMGLSDIVFPMFLFAMGMSIPYAIERRFSKGFSGESTLGHILSRTLALLLMGVFIVNAEGGFASTLGYGKGVYWLLMVTGFFLVWNCYPKDFRAKGWLQGTGIVVLAFLALTFRTPEGGYFNTGWWGILGLIGWAYLFCAVSYMLCRKRPAALAALWLGLIVVNILTTGLRDGSSLIPGSNFIGSFADALHLGNGSCALMAMGGILLSVSERHLDKHAARRRIIIGLAAAAILALAGLLAHQWWITSKNIGTLPWCLYVSGLSVAVYTLLRILEARNMTGWFKIIRPAGTATLTAYMVPYIFYILWVFINPEIPAWMCGWVGVLKCALFSMVCIGIAGAFERIGLKLKI